MARAVRLKEPTRVRQKEARRNNRSGGALVLSRGLGVGRPGTSGVGFTVISQVGGPNGSAKRHERLYNYRVVYFVTHALRAGDFEKFTRAKPSPRQRLHFDRRADCRRYAERHGGRVYESLCSPSS